MIQKCLNLLFKNPDFENKIKSRIARYDDRQLEISDVTLQKKKNYYVGFKKDSPHTYFIAYAEGIEDNYKVFRVFTRKKWVDSDMVNLSIITASKEIDSLGYEFDTIYNDADSFNMGLVEKNTGFICII